MGKNPGRAEIARLSRAEQGRSAEADVGGLGLGSRCKRVGEVGGRRDRREFVEGRLKASQNRTSGGGGGGRLVVEGAVGAPDYYEPRNNAPTLQLLAIPLVSSRVTAAAVDDDDGRRR